MGSELNFTYQETATLDMFLLSARKLMGKTHVDFTRRKNLL